MRHGKVIAELQQRIDARDKLIAELRTEYARLEDAREAVRAERDVWWADTLCAERSRKDGQ